MPALRQRKLLIAALGTSFLLLLLALLGLNGFNLKGLDPTGSSWVLLFTALSIIAFILCLIVGLLLVRNILKLLAEQRSSMLGSRLRTRMLVWAAMISILPVCFMFVFTYLLMNRSIDRWFNQPVTSLRSDSDQLAAELARYTTDNARAEADALALLFADPHYRFTQRQPADLQREMQRRQVTLQGGFAAIYRDGRQIAAFQLPVANGRPVEVRSWLTGHPATDETDADGDTDFAEDALAANGSVTPEQDSPDAAILAAAERNQDHIFSLGTGAQYALAAAWVRQGGVVVVGLPMPPGMSATVARLHSGSESYWRIFRARRQIRTTYLFLLLMVSGLTFFASTWLALQFSTQITRPIETLADAMGEIAAGRYNLRVDTAATQELGTLGHSFNKMAEDLATSRTLVEQTTRQITDANTQLESRRREVETMLETIPNGVVMLDAEARIVLANRAFAALLDSSANEILAGLPLSTIFPPDQAADLDRMVRRCQRIGHASAEFALPSPQGELSLIAYIAQVEGVSGTLAAAPTHSFVLVIEDVTDLLRAQKQMAWREVARRVAHEIKNPLTPVALSAERIRRHIEKIEAQLAAASLDASSTSVIRQCSQVISSSVETMRQLVDQFHALAQFPTAQPRPCSLNAIVTSALAIFSGRMQHVAVSTHLAPDLPAVLADPEAIKRALVNLIDNAAEAMLDSRLRQLTLATRITDDARHAELTVSDTGPGLPDEVRQRLFVPYVSTKERGTGLGLSITAKIVQEHGGSIRAVSNTPAGTSFIIELPLAAESGRHAEAS
jgi:hypothetical protein